MKSKVILLPKQEKLLKEFGENIRLARLRRRLSTDQVSERASISRRTLWAVENGTPTVSIGAYLQVLFILGLEKDLGNVAKDDEMGRKLQDSQLIIKERAPKRYSSRDTNDRKNGK